jgi:hypothetical protein
MTVRWLVVGVWLAVLAAPATAGATPIAESMGDLRWGLNAQDVERFLVRKVKERAAEELRKAKGSKKAAIESRRDQQVRQIEQSLVHFDGGRSRWDSGPVADQFTHGNNEAMLAYDDGKTRNYYFFIGDRLWKWYKSFPASEFGGRDFKRFQKLVTKKYGQGRVKDGEMYAGTGEERKWIEYLDRNTRLRAVDKVNPHGEYGLVFEEMATVRDLATLRIESGGPNRPKVAAKRSAPVREEEDEDEEQAAHATDRSKFKSIDDDSNQRGETRAEYEARKKKVLAEARAKDQAVHERKQDRKQGKTLDGLAGIEDDDPISGMR